MAVTKKNTEESKDLFQEKMRELEKRFGSGSIIYGKDTVENIETVSTGSLTLDIASGVGGYPVGKLIEVMGFESSGKSTAALHAIANFQKIGKCALIDFEQSFDRKYATALEVDMNSLIICQPSCMEDGYNIIEELVKTGQIRLVVIDSHTSAMPKKVVDGDVGEVTVGLQARINSQALGKIKPLLKDNRCTLMALSQFRQVVGSYGDPNQSTGGLAYRFYSDMRLKFVKVVNKDTSLNKTTVEVIKNKCGSPFGKAEFNISWGKGIDRQQEIIDIATEYKLLTKGGAGWYTIGETKLQGDEKLKEFFSDNPEFEADLTCRVLELIKTQ